MSPEINPRIYNRFDKDVKAIKWGKRMGFSTNGTREQVINTQKNEFAHISNNI